MKHLLKRLLPALATAALLSGAMIAALPAAPANAETPTQPVAEFFAQQCEGSTPSNPAVTRGVVPNLTYVFGQRLTDYNSGRTAILYGNAGSQGGTPNCAVRYEGGEAVTEWMYCTDHGSKVCSVTDDKGRLTQDRALVGSLAPLEGNKRLTRDQEKLIAYIVRNDLKVEPNFYLTGGVDKASNADVNTRSARQNLVWCISEQDDSEPTGLGGGFGADFVAKWCEDSFGQAVRAKALASFPSEPELAVSAANVETPVGAAARVKITTNLVNQPIQVTAEGPTLQLCADVENATYEDSVLTVSSDVAVTRDVDLCATSNVAGEVSASVSAFASDGDDIEWHQSAGTAGIVCQVYAHTDPGALTELSSSAKFTFVPVVIVPVEGQPGIELPELPDAEDPDAETPDIEEPGVPDAEAPGTEEPGAEEPGADEPGAEVPADDDADADAPVIEVPAVDEPEPDGPEVDQPVSDVNGDEEATEADGDEVIDDGTVEDADNDPAPVASVEGSESTVEGPAGSAPTTVVAGNVETLSTTGAEDNVAVTVAAGLLLLVGVTALVLARRKTGTTI